MGPHDVRDLLCSPSVAANPFWSGSMRHHLTLSSKAGDHRDYFVIIGFGNILHAHLHAPA